MSCASSPTASELVSAPERSALPVPLAYARSSNAEAAAGAGRCRRHPFTMAKGVAGPHPSSPPRVLTLDAHRAVDLRRVGVGPRSCVARHPRATRVPDPLELL